MIYKTKMFFQLTEELCDLLSATLIHSVEKLIIKLIIESIWLGLTGGGRTRQMSISAFFVSNTNISHLHIAKILSDPHTETTTRQWDWSDSPIFWWTKMS